jgi:putative Mg2+ transporter-C (MgtC) family protein
MDVIDLIIRMGLATLVGGVIGLERELRDHNAGFRTHILVCIGSAAFTLVSAYGFDAFLVGSDPEVRVDPSRVAAQIVTGIGFLGAGAIIRQGATVRGLTTAASLWAVAAIGMAIGLGLYALTLVTAAAVLISLSALRVIERRVIQPRLSNTAHLTLHFRGPGMRGLSQVVQLLDETGVALRGMVVGDDDEQHRIVLAVRLPKGLDVAWLERMVAELGVTDELDVS